MSTSNNTCLLPAVSLNTTSFLFSRVHATLQPALSVCRSVCRSVRHTLLIFAAPAHPHATKIAVCPAVFSLVACYATLHPAMSVRRSVRRLVVPFLGSGPEGADDLCFHTGEISPSPSSPSSSYPPQTPGPYLSLKTQILAARLKSQPGGSNPSL